MVHTTAYIIVKFLVFIYTIYKHGCAARNTELAGYGLETLDLRTDVWQTMLEEERAHLGEP
jgi:hypothetical protein